jgi:hypothetical protein
MAAFPAVREADVNRAELQKMAEERLKDPKVLLDGGRWEFAYYTAGYAAECGLKSCVLARMIYTAWIFEEKWQANVCRTHDLNELVKLADLTDQVNEQLKVSSVGGGEFATFWATAVNWTVASRYEAKSEADAKALYAAIADEPNGVLQWIKIYW